MRAQVSVYIIISLILLAIVGIGYNLIHTNEIKVDSPAQIEVPGVIRYVEQCLEETAKEGLLTIGLQGGYYYVPGHSISTIYSNVPYYYYMDDVSLLLTPKEMLSSLENYVSDNMDECMDINLPGYDVTTGNTSVSTMLGNDKVIIELDMPTTIKKGNQVSTHEKYSAEVNARLEDYYDIANFITTTTLSIPYFIDISQLFYLMDKHDIQIDTLSYDNAIIYVVQDNKSIINGVPMMFMFATLTDLWNHPPELYVEDMTAEAGREFYYQVAGYDREGSILEFSTDSDFFGINAWTGEINFTPEQARDHDVTFYVTDGIDTTEKTVRFVVR